MFAAVASMDSSARMPGKDIRGTQADHWLRRRRRLPDRLDRTVDLQGSGRARAARDRRLLHVGLRLPRQELQARPVGPVRRSQRRRHRQAAPQRRPADRRRRLRHRRHRGSRLRGLRHGRERRSSSGTVGGQPVTDDRSPSRCPSRARPPRSRAKRTGEETFGRLMLAIAAVILAARLVGALIARLEPAARDGRGARRHPARADAARRRLAGGQGLPLPAGHRPAARRRAAQIGLAFYLFLVGMELDPQILRDRIGQAAFISNTSVAFPMALGFLVALPIYKLLVAGRATTLPFALFMGVAMSITAFPVLARILIERRMLKRPVGALAMAGAAIDDVDRLVPARARDGGRRHRARRRTRSRSIALAARLHARRCSLIGRPAAGRASRRPTTRSATCRRSGSAIIFVGVLLSAYVAQQIGIAAIFGAFIMGLIMPRHAGLTADVTRALRGLRRPRPAAALLRRHRPQDRGRRAQPARCSGC